VEKHGRLRQTTDDDVIWNMRCACWIIKATDAHSEFVLLIIFFTATMVTPKRLSVV